MKKKTKKPNTTMKRPPASTTMLSCRCPCWLLQLSIVALLAFIPRVSAFVLANPPQVVPGGHAQSDLARRQRELLRPLHTDRDASKTSLSFMTSGLSDDVMLAFRPMHDISHALATWFQRIALPSWMPSMNMNVLTSAMGMCYAGLGVALLRLGGGMVPFFLLPMTWVLHSSLLLVAAELVFGWQRLRAGLGVSWVLLSSMVPILGVVSNLDQVAFWALLPYTSWLVFTTVLLQQVCHLNPTDEHGYNNAMLQAEIAQMQRRAARKVGLF